MAEAVVGVLIGKLGAALAKETAPYGASLLCREASSLKGLFREIRKAERELESMKAYLRESETFKDIDETTGIFIKNIRELSFCIEDVIDEFLYKHEDEKHGGFAAKIKKRIKHDKVWCRLAHNLHDINIELEAAKNRRDCYVTPAGTGRHVRSSDHHARSNGQTMCFARDEDLVGIEDNAEKLKLWLLGDLEENNKKIATVWGMGGVGKTTLVNHVYKIVKLDFDAAAWVTVSMNYQIDDLLKKIAREFGIPFNASNMEMTNLVLAIRSYLDGKRYILVLDDIWEMNVWISIMDIFPSNCISRFIFTTRKYEVASFATEKCVIKLEPLGENNSWKLFCMLAFRNNGDYMCPLELKDLSIKFLQKCKGLPVAIAWIARLLSYKPPTTSVWKNVHDELVLQSTKNVIPGIDVILKVSLEDLTYELKNCFLHCAIFPEDYLLKRKRLIRHWITAGFIKEVENKTLEEVAEGCLNELVNRSLLEVVKKNEFGRVKHCRMHDIIYLVALDKAKEECFGNVYKGQETFSLDSTRRLSIQSTGTKTSHESFSNSVTKYQSSATHLRAVYAFTSHVDIDMLRPVFASSHLLSTLDLEGCQIKKLPNEVFGS